jgi:NTE family protein
MSSRGDGALALVLSGGGARGAYELGVLRHVLGVIVPQLGAEAIPRILSGTSVGAINACCLAALAGAPGMGIEIIAERWQQLRLGDIFKLGWGDLTGMVRWVIGSPKPGGPESLLDAGPLADLVRNLLPWRALHQNVQSGLLRGVTVSATDVESGHTVVFVESEQPTPKQTDPSMEWLSTRLTVRHALASAAIPIVFPTVKVAGRVYSDGGLRQNTPLAPALRLGASRVMVISPKAAHERREAPRQGSAEQQDLSRPLFLFGKLLDALLLDRVESDLHNLHRVNQALTTLSLGSEGFVLPQEIASAMVQAGGALRPVGDILLRPSVDLGRLAADVLMRPVVRARLSGPAGFFLRRLGESAAEENGPSDVLSYLFFDGEYAHELMAQGVRDARAQEEEIARFLLGAA